MGQTWFSVFILVDLCVIGFQEANEHESSNTDAVSLRWNHGGGIKGVLAQLACHLQFRGIIP